MALTTQNAALRKRSGSIDSTDPLVSFLYILMRDHLTMGAVEGIVQKHVVLEGADDGDGSQFCNGHLAKYAQDVADRLIAKTASPQKTLVGVNELLNRPMTPELQGRVEAYARSLRDVPVEVLELALSYEYARYAAALGPTLRRILATTHSLDGSDLTTMALSGQPSFQVFGVDGTRDFSFTAQRQPRETLLDLAKRFPAEAAIAFQGFLGAESDPEPPVYYFAPYYGYKAANGRPVFRLVRKDHFDEHGHLDDRSKAEAERYLPPGFERIMDSTYTYNGAALFAQNIMLAMGWESPEKFRMFVDPEPKPTAPVGPVVTYTSFMAELAIRKVDGFASVVLMNEGVCTIFRHSPEAAFDREIDGLNIVAGLVGWVDHVPVIKTTGLPYPGYRIM